MKTEWRTRTGEILTDEDLPRISDQHLVRWLRMVNRLSLGANSAIGAPDDDTSNAATAMEAYYDTWHDLLVAEAQRRGLDL